MNLLYTVRTILFQIFSSNNKTDNNNFVFVLPQHFVNQGELTLLHSKDQNRIQTTTAINITNRQKDQLPFRFENVEITGKTLGSIQIVAKKKQACNTVKTVMEIIC